MSYLKLQRLLGSISISLKQVRLWVRGACSLLLPNQMTDLQLGEERHRGHWFLMVLAYLFPLIHPAELVYIYIYKLCSFIVFVLQVLRLFTHSFVPSSSFDHPTTSPTSSSFDHASLASRTFVRDDWRWRTVTGGSWRRGLVWDVERADETWDMEDLFVSGLCESYMLSFLGGHKKR